MTRARLICCLLISIGLGGFLGRTVLRAYVDDRNDLSDPYFASRLWLHGQNPYDVRLATQLSAKQIHSEMRLVPVYPPTAYVVLAPLGLLPWKLANSLWALLGLLAVGAMAYLLPEIADLRWSDDRAWLLAACVFCAAPLHTALHTANSSAVVICLCLLAVCLAKGDHDIWAGIVIAIAICLKPQLGIWVLVFYLVRRRWKIALPAAATVAAVTIVAVLRIPLSPPALLQNYGSNLHYWFDPGKMNDFSAANHFHFELVNAQVLLRGMVHSSAAANIIARITFGCSFSVWLWIVFRRQIHDELLALSALMMLAMLPIYHRSYDAAVVLLALAWILRNFKRPLGVNLSAGLVATFALLAPAPSAILEAIHQYQPGRTRDLASSSVLAGYSSAALMLLTFALLYRLAAESQMRVQITDQTLFAESQQENRSHVLLAPES